ncbi:hypothetical protein HPP92_002914 [Vanilla planifolia]|uniref:Uncharacterized protein n=1 Tax=Vanilla planifolia TaxID=51239 RepID=A0A835SEM5_VANPL|nr:hypothetical protein HPP92_002914 [Vanilla planifolia]
MAPDSLMRCCNGRSRTCAGRCFVEPTAMRLARFGTAAAFVRRMAKARLRSSPK